MKFSRFSRQMTDYLVGAQENYERKPTAEVQMLGSLDSTVRRNTNEENDISSRKIGRDSLKKALKMNDTDLFEMLYSMMCPSGSERVLLEDALVMMYTIMRNNEKSEDFALQLFDMKPQLGSKCILGNTVRPCINVAYGYRKIYRETGIR